MADLNGHLKEAGKIISEVSGHEITIDQLFERGIEHILAIFEMANDSPNKSMILDQLRGLSKILREIPSLMASTSRFSPEEILFMRILNLATKSFVLGVDTARDVIIQSAVRSDPRNKY